MLMTALRTCSCVCACMQANEARYMNGSKDGKGSADHKQQRSSQVSFQDRRLGACLLDGYRSLPNTLTQLLHMCWCKCSSKM